MRYLWDIDAINAAAIPIVIYQGINGGIGLPEGYRLDRNVLTDDELAAIVTALRIM
ncbi:hypothetical protein B4077_4174 [Bacillus cereus]|uniref:Uncharacterized protein n=1 Tax=Bacillus cereus TaxID=1396 RepID=A0A0G8F3F1_BACCE|nr:hypothetical protein [Bacillus cereus]KLA30954.1 hypothetical protein B4077_4174 [Bacillus cereus]